MSSHEYKQSGPDITTIVTNLVTNYSVIYGIVTKYLFVCLFVGIADVYAPMYRSEQLELV